MVKIWLFLTKIDHSVRLGDPIFTIYTIFFHSKAIPIQLTHSFVDLTLSKNQVTKGTPFEVRIGFYGSFISRMPQNHAGRLAYNSKLSSKLSIFTKTDFGCYDVIISSLALGLLCVYTCIVIRMNGSND